MMNGVTIIWWDWVRWCKGETCNDNSLLDVLRLIITLHKWSPPLHPRPRHPRRLWSAPTQRWHISTLWRVVTSSTWLSGGEQTLLGQVKPGSPTWASKTPTGHPARSSTSLPDIPHTVSHHLFSFLLLSGRAPPPSKNLFALQSVCPFLLNMPALLGVPLIQRGICLKELLRTSLGRIIAGPDGWCYISVPSHTRPAKRPLTTLTLSSCRSDLFSEIK